MASSLAEQSNSASVSPQLLPTRCAKNDLIEFALRSKMQVPEFHSRNEGQSHAPKFRSRVIVGGFMFITPRTFFHRKDAEEDVSRHALEWLINKLIEEGHSRVSKSVTFCKGTLNEFAIKLYMKLPTYNTVEYKSVIPYFVCTVDFNGTSYTGEAAARKKDAEDLAARSAILSFIGNSISGITLVQMLKKKADLFDSAKPRTVEHLSDRVIVLPVKDTTESHGHLQVLDDKDKDIVDALATHNMNQIVSPEPGPNIYTIQQPETPTLELTPQAANLSNVFQQPGAALSVDNIISPKKRRRNNYKANKRARLAAEVDKATSKVQISDSDLKSSPSKKKRACKSAKNNVIVDKHDNNLSSIVENIRIKKEAENGRMIGKLRVSNKEIAKGSNGTIVLEGIYEGRTVAVKRLVKAHHDKAHKEIQNLIASDFHPNIVRWYGVESDQDFVYLALERCAFNLDDLITDQAFEFFKKAPIETQCLWKTNGYPSPLLIKLMRDVVSGLAHLHELGIIHRDLKPQNVLIIKERSLCAKLSDMGISKQLLQDMSSLGHSSTGCGSSGWQAPEQLVQQGRQTRAVDLFSLGCVLFFCMTAGRHPFGDRLERDVNIVKNRKNLFLVEFLPEAEDLISCLLNPDPDLRPKAIEVLHHPLFWSSEMRLSFLRDVSDRVELEDRQTNSVLLNLLESTAQVALGGKWDEKVEPAFLANIGRYRRYKFGSVRDLLRVIRNKLNHFRGLPQEIQELIGPIPEGFNDYFTSRFPRLLIEVYKVICNYCKNDECFQRYFRDID